MFGAGFTGGIPVCLQFFVGTVAERCAVIAFAAAKVGCFCFFSSELYGCKRRWLMGTVTKWLVLAQATAAIVVILASFQIDSKGAFLSNNGGCHINISDFERIGNRIMIEKLDRKYHNNIDQFIRIIRWKCK